MSKNFIGKKVIVRGDRSGVFFGTLAEKDGKEFIELCENDYGGEVIKQLKERVEA